jgi:hypothetical protein
MSRKDEYNLDQVAEAVRLDVPDLELTQAAGSRVWKRLTELDRRTEARAPERLRSCEDFRSLFADYLAGELSDARRMLVEDHTHACPACRKALDRARGEKPVMIPFARPVNRRPVLRWAMAVAAAILLVAVAPFAADRMLSPSGVRATVASVDGRLFKVTAQGLLPLEAGAVLNERDEVRTAKASYATLQLADGSVVELDERAEVAVSRGWRGATLKLVRGNIIVEAAKQGRNRLQVDSGEALVTVKGTIFAVSRGAKGSRVSVVEGEVQVDQASQSQMLKPGQQAASDATLQATSIADEIAWSKNAARYLALMGELSLIEKRLSAIPGPALRYSSRLSKLVPANTVVYVALPNLAPAIADAQRLIEERVRESAALKEWWNESSSVEMRLAIDKVRAVSEYLGDEIVIAAEVSGGRSLEPLVLAEIKKPGLREYLSKQMQALGFTSMNATDQVAPSIVADFAAAQSQRGAVIVVTNDLMVMAPKGADAAAVAARRSGAGAPANQFLTRMEKAYQHGAGWLIGADLKRLVADASGRAAPQREMSIAGLDTVEHLVFERKETGRTENRATLSFAGERHGVMSWLAKPGPMGSLDFVTPNAGFASSFVVKNPRLMAEEMMKDFGGSGDLAKALAEFRTQTGVDLMNDLAASLGGEATFALDGGLFPKPGWKLVAEVYDANKLVWSLERLVEAANRKLSGNGGKKLAFSKEVANGRTYYRIATPQLPFDIHFTFADSYWIAGPGRENLDRAIQSRNAGVTLPKSEKFRALLPRDGYAHFSALVYSDLASTASLMAEQLRNSGLLTPEQQKSIGLLEANKEPSLIFAYGEQDRITVASSGSFFGLGLDALLGLNAPGTSVMPMLMAPGIRGSGLFPAAR